MNIQGHNIQDDFPKVEPKMSLAMAIKLRDSEIIQCQEHNGTVEDMNAIAALRYGMCLDCARKLKEKA